jgi:hypothetical protein
MHGNVQSLNRFATLPFRPIRLIRIFAKEALLRVPLYCLAGGTALFYAAQAMAPELGASMLGAVGTWSFTLALTSMGVVLGACAGLAAAAAGVLRSAENEVRDWLMQISAVEGDRLFPSIDLERLRSGHDAIVDSIYMKTVGRMPLPAFVGRRVQRRFRQALVDDFLTECEQRGAARVGFAEVRDFLLQQALTVATRPVHAPLRICAALFLALLAASVFVPFLVATLAD